ncbi:MAG: adenylyl-sulfate kinase, partial [Myxococcales bacterium]|nr:adenylyl-sulfate kinase [Myxococcales bacterium]
MADSNIKWHAASVSRELRASLHRNRGAAVWLTGLPASGKSTLARALERRLVERGVFAYVLDGDNLRHGLNRDLGFSPADRQENIRRVGEVTALFVDAGAVVISAFISPYRADRDRVRGLLQVGEFLEVHVAAPLEVCEARDPKGLYAKARAGGLANFTGIDAPYEPPSAPELVLPTHELSPDQSTAQLEQLLIRRRV